jgi:biotin carboxyl carrier protein
MEDTYKAIVNQSFEFSLDSGALSAIDSIQKSESQYHLIHNGRSVLAEVVSKDFLNRTYTLKIGGNRYVVSLGDSLDALIEELGLSLGSSSIANEIHAPMPGLILEVAVAVGDSVSQGDPLCVLEAMKMENALTAPRDGVIKAVHISTGETVDKNALLIELQD